MKINVRTYFNAEDFVDVAHPTTPETVAHDSQQLIQKTGRQFSGQEVECVNGTMVNGRNAWFAKFSVLEDDGDADGA